MSTRRKKGPHEPSDRIRIEHMRLAAREGIAFVAGRTRPDLDSDRMLQRALLHAVLEIGEAAANVSQESRARVAGVEWDSIVKMRNVLVHVYWGVSLDKLWQTAQVDLPALLRSLDEALVSWSLTTT